MNTEIEGRLQNVYHVPEIVVWNEGIVCGTAFDKEARELVCGGTAVSQRRTKALGRRKSSRTLLSETNGLTLTRRYPPLL
jgi:hypothetical protein